MGLVIRDYILTGNKKYILRIRVTHSGLTVSYR